MATLSFLRNDDRRLPVSDVGLPIEDAGGTSREVRVAGHDNAKLKSGPCLDSTNLHDCRYQFLPTATEAPRRRGKCGRCGQLRCGGSGCAHFLEPTCGLVMQVAIRFSMRRSERKGPPP